MAQHPSADRSCLEGGARGGRRARASGRGLRVAADARHRRRPEAARAFHRAGVPATSNVAAGQTHGTARALRAFSETGGALQDSNLRPPGSQRRDGIRTRPISLGEFDRATRCVTREHSENLRPERFPNGSYQPLIDLDGRVNACCSCVSVPERLLNPREVVSSLQEKLRCIGVAKRIASNRNEGTLGSVNNARIHSFLRQLLDSRLTGPPHGGRAKLRHPPQEAAPCDARLPTRPGPRRW